MKDTESKNWIIVGGGFSGLTASAMLANQGQTVTLLEQSPRLGGVLNSPKSNGLYLDLGCHLFNNSDPETTKFLFDILDGDYHPVEVSYASITHDGKVEGLAIPDFTNFSEEQKAKILYQQATQLANDETEYADLNAYIENRYGKTISEKLTPIVQKIAVADPTELDQSTFQRTPINRIRVFDDQVGELLKQIPEFDDILAVPSQEDPLRFYPEAEKQYPHKNYYPSKNGMRGFVTAATDYIEDRGVEIVKNCEITDLRSANGSIRVGFEDSPEIETGNVVWTAGPDALAPLLEGGISWEYTHDVPMVLYYFFVPAQSDVDHTYIHDFRPDSTVYRASAPGFYGNQTNSDGQSYICVEVPTSTDSAIWEEPDAFTDSIWETIVEYGMISGIELPEFEIKQTPVSYPLYKAGSQSAFAELNRQLESELPGVHLLGLDTFSKTDIVQRLRQIVQNECGGRGDKPITPTS